MESQIPEEELRQALVKIGTGELLPGVRHEPRAFFDIIPLAGRRITKSQGETFRNGEQFPIRLTHMLAMVAPYDQDDELADERLLQRIGIRFSFHDQHYLQQDFLPAAIYANEQVAAAPAVALSTASWWHQKPYVMSARDTLIHNVQLVTAPESPTRVTVLHSGIGLLSGRPYLLSGFTDLADAVQTDILTRNYRNDGREPIAIRQTKVMVAPEEDAEGGSGDLRQLLLNLRHTGNGTDAFWFQGSQDPAQPLMPAGLMGVHTGQALVHRWAGPGLLWETGEGIDIEVVSLDESADNVILWIALCGYITVS